MQVRKVKERVEEEVAAAVVEEADEAEVGEEEEEQEPKAEGEEVRVREVAVTLMPRGRGAMTRRCLVWEREREVERVLGHEAIIIQPIGYYTIIRSIPCMCIPGVENL